MEAQMDKENAGEKSTRKCFSCGYEDTGNYCSNCGSKLEFLGDEKASSLQNLWNILKEYFQEILDPTFAYLKTIYLLIRNPVDFFDVLCFQGQPINDIYFPLGFLWRRVSGNSRTQYTLHPIAFYTSNFVINVISGAISLIFVLVVLKTGDYQPNDLPSIPALSSAGLFTLLYMLGSAFVFDILTKESNISPQFKYSFWVYIFSLVWLGWLVVFIALLFLLPIFLILGCIMVCCIVFIFLLITLNSVASADLFQTLLGAYSYISSFASIFVAGVGGVYIFLIIPKKVFSHIFQRVNFPTNNLWGIILASLIIPAIPLSLCAFPLLINQLRSLY